MEMELELRAEFLNGQIAVDNVAVVDVEWGLLAGWDFNSPSARDGWSVTNSPDDYPAGTAYWAADGGHWGNLASPQPTGGYVLTNAGGGLWQTAPYATAAGQSYQVQAALRGQAAWFQPARWQVNFFDENGAENGSQLLWSDVSSLNGDVWQEVDQTFTIPAGTTHFQLVLDAPQLGGWLALDGVRLANLSQPIPASGGRDYTLSALVAGQTAAAGQESAALLVTYYHSDGSQIGSDTVWGEVDYNQVPAALQSGGFTTPAGTAYIRLGLATSVDNDAAAGWLLYDRIALTALSQPVTIVPGRSYEVSAQVAGELNGPAGEVSGQLAAHFYDSQGVLLAVSPVWQSDAYEQPVTPLTQSGSVSHTTATQMRLGLMTVLDEGWLDFSEPHLQWLHLEYTITRKTYSFAGRTIATRVSGDVEGDNGLFYIHSDHLGSTSVMSYGQGHAQQGQEVPGSPTHYLPFGDWRVEPSHDLTDQGFTGQKHNMDLGLYYYNARWYLPGVGRFASADTIVPDPMNPQQFNRYTYVLNNPLRFTDPTGHYCYDPSSGADLVGTCIHDDGTTYHLARDPI